MDKLIQKNPAFKMQFSYIKNYIYNLIVINKFNKIMPIFARF